MKKNTGKLGLCALLVGLNLGSAFAIKPEEKQINDLNQGRENPARTGFQKLRGLIPQDLLEKGESLRLNRVELKGDAGTQVLKKLNLRLQAGSSEVKLVSVQSDTKNNKHFRLIQHYKGIPVIGTDMVVHVNSANEIYAVGGSIAQSLNLPIQPKVAVTLASQKAKATLGASLAIIEKQSPKLVIYSNALAYEVVLKEPGKTPSLWKTYIDAQSGELIYRENQILHGAPVGGAAATVRGSRLVGENGTEAIMNGWRDNSAIYFLRNNTNLWGVYDQDRFDWSQNLTGDWLATDRAAVSLARNMEVTQNYVSTVLHRNSFDNAGAFASAYVHEGDNYVNAYWDGSAFYFGDGDGSTASPLTVLDVAAHEYGHAITQYTSGLNYSYESGALNESFSDIHGALVEFSVQPDGRGVYPNGTDGQADWLLGEDCWLSSEALRDLRNPQRFGQPSYYLGTNWYAGGGDNGGVHYNSGVQNFAFYLLSEGGNSSNDGHAYNITGLGIVQAGEIAMYANMFLLTSTAQYADTRDAWILAATTLGYNAQTVRDVWTACGVLEQVNNLAVTPSSLNFGNVGNGSFAVLNLTLSNSGARPTIVSNLTFNNAVFSSSATLPLLVPGGGSIQLPVRFSPIALGAQVGILTISSDADDNASIPVSLSGSGTLPAGITVTPTSISRSVAVGDIATASLHVVNTGVADLVVSPFAVADPLSFGLKAAPVKLIPYDASHFVKLAKGQADTRVGRPVLNGMGGPDIFGYRWADSDEPNGPAFTWNDIQFTGTMLPTASNCDDCFDSQTLTFPFSFYGSDYSSINVSSNGYITFGAPAYSYVNYPLPSTSMPVGLVAGFFDDLSTSTGDVFFQDFGDHAIIQYQDVGRLGGDGAVTFQIVLKASGEIDLYYANVVGNLLDATTGIQNGDATDGLTVQYNTAYLKNNLAVRLVAQAPWLSVAGEGQPRIIAQGGTADLTVTLDATQILGGAYTGSINLSHNAPGTANPLAVPVTFAVDGYRRLSVSPSVLNFGNRRIGSTQSLELILTNTGDEATTISGLVLGNSPEFSLVGTLPTVLPGKQSVTVTVAFAPVDLGAEATILTINSNAEDFPVLSVDVSGAGLPAPQVSVNPTSFSVSLVTGEQTTRELNISNPGGDNLIWSLKGAGLAADLTGVKPQAAGLNILLLRAGVGFEGFEAEVRALPNVASVVAWEGASTVPTLNDLQAYNALIVVSNNYWASPLAIGDVLADYVDGGGAVLLMGSTFHMGGDWMLQGRIMTSAYAPLGASSYGVLSATSAILVSHPINAGVSSLTTGLYAFNTAPQGASISLGAYTDGSLVGAYNPTKSIVSLNAFVQPGYYGGDLLAQVKNSLDFLANGNWLSASMLAGVLPPGQNQLVTLTFNAANMLGGTYLGNLGLEHDAPGTINPLPIPTTLIVDGFRSLTVTPSTLPFGNVWSGSQASRTITLTNSGSEVTTVQSLTFSGFEFSSSTILPLVIEPFKSISVNVVFAPMDLGLKSAALIIASDAEDNSSLIVALSGTGTVAPLAELTPTAMVFDLAPSDAPADHTATLANSGGDVLEYQVSSIVQTGSPLFTAKISAGPTAVDLAKIYAESNYTKSMVPGEVIVALKPGKLNFSSQAVLGTIGTLKVKELAIAKNPHTGLRTHVGRKLLLIKMSVGSSYSLSSAIAQIRSDANVEYVEPNYIRKLSAIPNDASFPALYGMHNVGQTGGTNDADIDAPEAWDKHTGNKSLILGLIDTGIDYLHPDLAENVWVNAAEATGTPGIDDDGNGYTDDVHGYDFINNDSDPMDDHGHGTHTGGTIGAVGNNNIGVAGVAWTANVAGLKIFSGGGSTTDEAILNAVDYSNAMGMKITSNSWGGGPYSQSLYDLIAEGRDLGHLFIAAAGNNGSDTDLGANYPSGYELDNIISVAATDHNDGLAGFSNYGLLTVDLGAPGVDTYSCQPGGGYQSMSGTSMATPHVAGAAYLVWSSNNLLSASKVKEILLGSVDLIPSLSGRTVTGGRLNIAEALNDAGPSWLTASPMTAGTVDPSATTPIVVTVNPAGLVAGAWTGLVKVTTNDPAHPELSVAVTANISGCKSLAVEDSLDFGTQFVGAQSQAYLFLKNDCNDVVTITSISSSNSVFSFMANLPLTIPAFSEIALEVGFSSMSAGSFAGTMTLITDADENPIKVSQLFGQSSLPAHAVVNPPVIARTLGLGRSTTVNVDISNTGGSILDWQLAGVDQGLHVAPIPYDATHFVEILKGKVDARVGRPVLHGVGGPDAFGYRWSDSDESGGPVFTWNDIQFTGAILPTASNCDDCYDYQPLSFPMSFYGEVFNSIYVSSNGYLTFGNPSSQFSNYPLPSTNMPANLVAGFFDDLATYTGDIYFQDFGDHAIIQYQNVQRLSGDGAVTFQIVIKTSGEIDIYYLTVTGNLVSATTGIQNGTGTDGLLVQYNTTYVKDNLALRFVAQAPWLHVSNLTGVVEAGQSQQIVLTLNAAGLAPGVYNQTMTLSHNNPLELPLEIPVTLTVGRGGVSQVLRVGTAALAKSAGSRYSLWNISVGGETRGVGHGSRFTLYMD